MKTDFEKWRTERESSRVDLHVESATWETPNEVWSALLGIPGSTGWVCRPSEISEWPCDAHGLLLSAEVAGTDGTSLHVRRTGHSWSGWRYRETTGVRFVKRREERIGTVPGRDRTLHYAVYWGLLPENGIEVYRPFAARFTGWEGA